MNDEKRHTPLPCRRAAEELVIQYPWGSPRVTASSPAIEVMTDLGVVSPGTVVPSATLNEATQVMIARGVRLLLVTEKDDDRVLGLITARDTKGERPIRWVQERGGRYEDLQVRDLMIPRESIEIVDIADVQRAEVGDVVATLKACGRQHALVTEKDPESGATRLRGVFSATQISRQLGLPIQTFDVARTFADIQSAILRDY